jgi:hypothetical protein
LYKIYKYAVIIRALEGEVYVRYPGSKLTGFSSTCHSAWDISPTYTETRTFTASCFGRMSELQLNHAPFVSEEDSVGYRITEFHNGPLRAFRPVQVCLDQPEYARGAVLFLRPSVSHHLFLLSAKGDRFLFFITVPDPSLDCVRRECNVPYSE